MTWDKNSHLFIGEKVRNKNYCTSVPYNERGTEINPPMKTTTTATTTAVLLLSATIALVESRTSLRGVRSVQALDPKTVYFKPLPNVLAVTELTGGEAEGQEVTNAVDTTEGAPPLNEVIQDQPMIAESGSNPESAPPPQPKDGGEGDSGIIVQNGGVPEMAAAAGEPEAPPAEGVAVVNGGAPVDGTMLKENDESGIVIDNGGVPVTEGGDGEQAPPPAEEQQEGDKEGDKEEKPSEQVVPQEEEVLPETEAGQGDGIVVSNGGVPIKEGEEATDAQPTTEGDVVASPEEPTFLDNGVTVLSGGDGAIQATSDGDETNGQVVVSAPKATPVVETGPRKRRFISYTSSKWETMWMDNVNQWAESKQICDVLLNDQAQMVHDFLNLTCTSRYVGEFSNWCIIDDEYHPLWYNTANRHEFQLLWESPLPPKAELGPPAPVIPGPQHEHIVSKFVFLDETTNEYHVEYIEPLVSHLRFPLCKCIGNVPDKPEYKYHYTTFRGWIIPPPPGIPRDRALYFDAGASSWDEGSGGPSLKYFFNMWQRHEISFDSIFAFEMTTPSDEFYKAIPLYYKSLTNYKQCAVSSKPEDDSDETPFLPNLIKRAATMDDYVVFKLDIDSAVVEDGNIEFILDDPDNTVDELVWEHHIAGNYLLTEWGKAVSPISLRGSYAYFLGMRNKGIRAHSWV